MTKPNEETIKAAVQQSNVRAYEHGQKTAYLSLLHVCLTNLNQENRDKNSWLLERGEALGALRSLCADFGDNDWDESMHLSDIIDKHLGKHLHGQGE